MLRSGAPQQLFAKCTEELPIASIENKMLRGASPELFGSAQGRLAKGSV